MTPTLLLISDDTPASRAARASEQARELGKLAEGAALSVWRAALAEAEALAALGPVSVGARQIAADAARDLSRHILRLQVLHARQP